jgi:hypothetical protein
MLAAAQAVRVRRLRPQASGSIGRFRASFFLHEIEIAQFQGAPESFAVHAVYEVGKCRLGLSRVHR